jgi:hypothetical protein
MGKLTIALASVGLAAGCLTGAGVTATPAHAASACTYSNVTLSSYVKAYNNTCSWIRGALTTNGSWVYGNTAGRGAWTNMNTCYANVSNQRVNYSI